MESYPVMKSYPDWLRIEEASAMIIVSDVAISALPKWV